MTRLKQLLRRTYANWLMAADDLNDESLTEAVKVRTI